MTQLLSASRDIASWDWYVDNENSQGLGKASGMVLSVSEILTRHSLLELDEVRVSWHKFGHGSIGFRSLVSLNGAGDLSAGVLADRITASQPVGCPEAYVGQIDLLGSGFWINSSGEMKLENRLVDVSLLIDPVDISVALSVRHDIWMWFDFSGIPHSEVYHNNAPRLSAALREIEEALETEIIPGDATYFAEPEGYGIATPDANLLGLGRNETHML